MITRSPECRPERMTRMSSISRPDFDRALADDAIVADHVRHLPRLVVHHALVGNEHRLRRLRLRTGACARTCPASGSPSGSAPRARARIVPEPASSALSMNSMCPFQRNSVSSCSRISTALPSRVTALLALVFQQRGLGCIEDETDRIERHDGGQHRCARLHQVAGGEAVPRDLAAEGRRHAGELEIQPLACDVRLGRRDVRRGLQLRCADRSSRSDWLMRWVSISVLPRLRAASAFACAAFARASCARDCASCASNGRGSIDEQQLPLLHVLPVLEMHRLAACPRHAGALRRRPPPRSGRRSRPSPYLRARAAPRPSRWGPDRQAGRSCRSPPARQATCTTGKPGSLGKCGEFHSDEASLCARRLPSDATPEYWRERAVRTRTVCVPIRWSASCAQVARAARLAECHARENQGSPHRHARCERFAEDQPPPPDPEQRNDVGDRGGARRADAMDEPVIQDIREPRAHHAEERGATHEASGMGWCGQVAMANGATSTLALRDVADAMALAGTPIR